MDGKQKAAADRIYQNFEPSTELSSENDSDTILIYVPGFQKEQLKVQFSKARELIISGERLVGDNTWQRFQKTVAVSPNCDMEKITAKFKFEDQILYIIQPKLITSENKQDHDKLMPGAQTPEPQKFINEKKHPNNENDESRQKRTGPDLTTNQTGDAAANGETALKKVKEEVSNDRKSGESSDYKPWDPRYSVENALEKVTTNKKNDGDVAESDKMKGTKNQKDEPDSENFTCKMNERASKGPGLATNIKMPRQVINLVLAVLLAIALGLYVKNSASFWKKDEN
ncbi:SHSP domain-containing protein [Heracleum sosnowskyi]|uniref:SHSP domain-containing protein n=1 Tax=Heracleum sosnowskyi TaxID=360622 RepID=A0AAD8LZU5_9APIA|nr:SHSP domain-containing protein [Heracleum sosnowskyi]